MTDVSQPAAIDTRRARVALSRTHLRIVLVAWGLAFASYAGYAFNLQAATPFMQTRMDGVAASIAVMQRGGPPLLGSNVPYHEGIAPSHLQPLGVTDDQGIYVVLPLLSKLTGETSPSILMKWFFIGCFVLLLGVYPLLFYEALGSALVGILAPIGVYWKFKYAEGLDLYWISAWCMLLCLPGLMLAYRLWKTRRRSSIALLVGLTLAASFATAIRIDTGLPIIIGGLGIVLAAGGAWWRRERLWKRPLIAGVLVVCYFAIGTFALAGVRAYRNHVIHDPAFGRGQPTEHPFWHNAYIGLGYLPNPYGIAWSDSVGADTGERAAGVGYLQPGYESTLRHLYWKIFQEDPGFVLRNYWVKARTILGHALDAFWPAFVLLPIGLLYGRTRRRMRRYALLALPAVAIGALPPILTIPNPTYSLAWAGAWGALWLLALGWLVVEVSAVLKRREARQLLPTLLGPRSLVVAGVALLVGVLAAVVTPGAPPSAYADYTAGQSALRPSPASGSSLLDWRFDGHLPRGWVSTSNTFVQPDYGETPLRGLYVRSGMAPDGVTAKSPSVSLRPGRYEVVGTGRILAGGLAIRVHDTATDKVLGRSRYSYLQTYSAGETLVVKFRLSNPASVRVTIDNWTPFPNASASILWNLSIHRLAEAR